MAAEPTPFPIARVTAPGSRGDWATVGDVEIATVPFDAPWDWLGAGWRDLTVVPAVSLAYGGAFAFAAIGLFWGLLEVGLVSLMMALSAGFLLLAPLVGVGLYEVSRRLEAGERPTLGDALLAGLRAPGQLSFFGVALAFAFGAWLQLALLLFMMFLGGQGFPPLKDFLPMLLFTHHGLGLLVVGTMAGGIIAAFVFSISAVAVPLLLEKRMDAVSAMIVSLRAVAQNPKPMALWAALIAGFMVLGLATLFAGFVVAFPLIGHATWHCYRHIVWFKT